jgi:phospholipase D1/2
MRRALSELFSLRWERATHIPAPAIVEGFDPWPASLAVNAHDVDVGIARTEPSYHERKPVREVEQNLLDAIARARDFIYIENQYVTSERICAALSERLKQAGGPDIVIVTSRKLTTPLERRTMGVLQAACVEKLRNADEHGRLRVVGPRVDDVDVHVHSKLMIVDDDILVLGSSNLTSRSLSQDTELNLVIEAGVRADVKKAITTFRARLLAEHCNGVLEHGLIESVDAACTPERNRCLVPVESEPIKTDLLADVADPKKPLTQTLAERAKRPAVVMAALALGALFVRLLRRGLRP